MSNELTEQEQAIYQHVIAPAFYQKCAERGRQLDPSELELHLENAAMVQQARQKEATSMAKTANALLKTSLGLTEAPVKPAVDQSVKAAAAKIAANPELAKLLSSGQLSKEALSTLGGAGIGAGLGGMVGGLPGAAIGGLAGGALTGAGKLLYGEMGLGGNTLSDKNQEMTDRNQKLIHDNQEISRNAQLARGAYKAAPNPYGEGQ